MIIPYKGINRLLTSLYGINTRSLCFRARGTVYNTIQYNTIYDEIDSLIRIKNTFSNDDAETIIVKLMVDVLG